MFWTPVYVAEAIPARSRVLHQDMVYIFSNAFLRGTVAAAIPRTSRYSKVKERRAHILQA